MQGDEGTAARTDERGHERAECRPEAWRHGSSPAAAVPLRCHKDVLGQGRIGGQAERPNGVAHAVLLLVIERHDAVRRALPVRVCVVERANQALLLAVEQHKGDGARGSVQAPQRRHGARNP